MKNRLFRFAFQGVVARQTKVKDQFRVLVARLAVLALATLAVLAVLAVMSVIAALG